MTRRNEKMKIKTGFHIKTSAQSILEFALVLPVLLTLLYGVLESGRLLFIYGSTINAARQAVRYGSATGTSPNGTPYYADCIGIRDAAKKSGFINRFEDADILITYDEGLNDDGTVNQISDPDPACGTYSALKNGDRVKVSVSTQWAPIVSILPFDPFQITSESERTILLSVDIVAESEPSIFDGNGAGCARLTSISASPNPYSSAGSVVTYTYNLTNAGSEILESPSIIDSRAGAISCPASVAAGASFTCTGTYTITQADIESGSVSNTAVPTVYCGTKSSNTITKAITAFQNPGLALQKTPSVEAISVPGAIITYTYTLTNTGNVTLSGPFSVTDDRIASVNCASASSSLAPGASTFCTATHTLSTSDIADRQIVNVATAYGNFNSTPVTSNSTSAIVYTPPMYLVVVPSALSATAANQVITYTYNIKNITDVPITSPNVDDELLSVDCSAATDNIPVGGSVKCTASYTVTQAIMDSGDSIVNSATAFGLREGQSVSSNTFNLTTPVTQSPALTVVLQTVPSETPLNSGSTVTYTYQLTNSGNVTLTAPITVHDDHATITCSDQSNFAPGSTRNCTGAYTVQPGDMNQGSINNEGYASAKFGSTDVQSNLVSNTLATFQGARFNIAASADKSIVTYSGEIITYTYTFINTGSTDLELPFTITSSLGSSSPSSALDCSLVSGPVSPGSSATCRSTYTVTSSGAVTNTVTDATIQHAGSTIHASNVPLPALTTTAYICTAANLGYTASPSSGGSGNSTVTWTISNTVGTSLPISAVVISWANSGNGNSDTHLNSVVISNSTLNLSTLPDKVSSYISGTGTLNSGTTNITMDFSKNNPSGISVTVIFANPYSTCHLP
jgi:hypothetical protein